MAKLLVVALNPGLTDGLVEHGHEVIAVADPSSALKILADAAPDLVVARPEAARAVAREMGWMAPWTPLLVVADPGETVPDVDAVILHDPQDSQVLAAWVEAELMVRKAAPRW
ncbi:MAG: hypothetical protein AB1758_13465 [Candidatus Eremiobacterota bacterium]